jgi:hypothetical protein
MTLHCGYSIVRRAIAVVAVATNDGRGDDLRSQARWTKDRRLPC